MFTLVTGGLRSGKSEYALRSASELGPPTWLWIGTHIEGDYERKARLAKHRREQDATCRLLDAPDHLESAFSPEKLDGVGAAVLDRFTIWVSTRLESSQASSDADLLSEVERLADRL